MACWKKERILLEVTFHWNGLYVVLAEQISNRPLAGIYRIPSQQE